LKRWLCILAFLAGVAGPALAGVTGGPRCCVMRAPASSSVIFTLDFDGSTMARVTLKGERSSSFKLSAYDLDGRAVSEGHGSCIFLHWVPPVSRPYKIVVKNLSKTDESAFFIQTN
jgi:hypothetical protein